MNKSILKALLAIGFMMSPVLAATDFTSIAHDFSTRAYNCRNSTNPTNDLCTLIRSYNTNGRSLAFTVSKFIMGAGSLVVAKEAAIAAIAEANENEQLIRAQQASNAKIAEIKAAVESNTQLNGYANEIEAMLQSNAALSKQVEEKISVLSKLKAAGGAAWTALTTTATLAYNNLKATLTRQVDAVVRMISQSCITVDEEHDGVV